MYEQILQYYDLIHRGLSEDINYIIKLAARLEQPILELGCGTGRILLPLAKTGHVVVGVDSSQAMLALMTEKIQGEEPSVQERLELHHLDMSNFRLNQRFGLIILPHNTVMHLDRSQLRQTLQNVRKHLLPGGCLFIDLDNPAEVADPIDDGLLVLERTVYDEEKGTILLQLSSSQVDTRRQIREVTWIFDENPAVGTGVTRTVVNVTFHYYMAHELDLLLNDAGLKIQATYGTYGQEPYNEQSPLLLIEATPYFH